MLFNTHIIRGLCISARRCNANHTERFESLYTFDIRDQVEAEQKCPSV